MTTPETARALRKKRPPETLRNLTYARGHGEQRTYSWHKNTLLDAILDTGIWPDLKCQLVQVVLITSEIST